AQYGLAVDCGQGEGLFVQVRGFWGDEDQVGRSHVAHHSRHGADVPRVLRPHQHHPTAIHQRRARSRASSFAPLKFTLPLPSTGTSSTGTKSRNDGTHRLGRPTSPTASCHAPTPRPVAASVASTYSTTTRSPRDSSGTHVTTHTRSVTPSTSCSASST